MPRRDNTPSISFFSFQDIITSITGIMFLVVMILVLLVVTRERPHPSSQDAQKQALKQKLEQLQKQADERQRQLETLTKRLDELKKLDVTSLPQKKEDLIQQLQSIQKRIQDEEERQKQLQKQLEENAEKKTQEQQNLDKISQDQDEAQRLVESLETQKLEEEKKLAKNSRMIRFIWKSSIIKKPLLIACSENDIKVFELNASKPLKQFHHSSQANLCGEFLQWVTTQYKASDIYLVLLAKPSSFEYIEHLAFQLGNANFDRGREILQEDMELESLGDEP